MARFDSLEKAFSVAPKATERFSGYEPTRDFLKKIKAQKAEREIDRKKRREAALKAAAAAFIRRISNGSLNIQIGEILNAKGVSLSDELTAKAKAEKAKKLAAQKAARKAAAEKAARAAAALKAAKEAAPKAANPRRKGWGFTKQQIVAAALDLLRGEKEKTVAAIEAAKKKLEEDLKDQELLCFYRAEARGKKDLSALILNIGAEIEASIEKAKAEILTLNRRLNEVAILIRRVEKIAKAIAA